MEQCRVAKVKIVLNTEQKLAGHKQRILLNEHKLYQLSTTSVRNSKCSCYVLEESVTIITYFTFVLKKKFQSITL